MYFTDDISGIGKIYGKQVVRNGEVYMSAEKLIVDFVMRNARFRVKDAVHVQLSELNGLMKTYNVDSDYENFDFNETKFSCLFLKR